MTNPGPRNPWPDPRAGFPPGAYPPAPVPQPPPHNPRRTGLRILGIIAAVVLGIPGLFVVAGIIYVGVRGVQDPADPTPAPGTPPVASATQAPDPLDPVDLAEGDCYNAAPLPTEGETVIHSVEPAPCTEPHTAQVVARFAYPAVIWDEATDATSTRDCEEAFRSRLTEDVLADERYQLGRIHSDRADPGVLSVFAACVVVTEAPTISSALSA